MGIGKRKGGAKTTTKTKKIQKRGQGKIIKKGIKCNHCSNNATSLKNCDFNTSPDCYLKGCDDCCINLCDICDNNVCTECFDEDNHSNSNRRYVCTHCLDNNICGECLKKSKALYDCIGGSNENAYCFKKICWMCSCNCEKCKKNENMCGDCWDTECEFKSSHDNDNYPVCMCCKRK